MDLNSVSRQKIKDCQITLENDSFVPSPLKPFLLPLGYPICSSECPIKSLVYIGGP